MSILKNSAKIKYILFVVLVFIFVVSAYFVFFSDNKIAKADWWNDSWIYRKSVQVTNNTSEESNVYISLTIDTFATSTIQSDCGDLRFTRANGEVLDYYLVSGCETASTVVHVNFAVFASGEQAIYYYYGNESAENGFKASDFSTEASNYTIGSVGSEETGPGPVGYWSFDEGYGTIAHDGTSGNYDGTITGAEWKNEEECVSGKCLYFDGVDLTRVEADAPDNMEEFTACAWMKANSLINADEDTYITVIEKKWVLHFNNSGQLDFYVQTSSSYPSVNGSENLVINQWYYVCGVYYGIGIYPKMFVNGIDKSTNQTSGGGTQNDDSNTEVSVGGSEYSNNFNGYIDEVKIYPYARSADQIKQDYAQGLAGQGSAHSASVYLGSKSDSWMSDGLVGYWKMDETATTSGAIDSSGNGNDGVYYGNASTTGGKFGNGGVFDGDGDYVECADSDKLDGSSEMSWSFWANLSTDTGNRGVINKYVTSVGGRSYGMWFDSAEDLNVRISSDGDNQETKIAQTNLLQDEWSHIVVIFNKGSFNVYKDGEITANDGDFSNHLSIYSGSDDLKIGRQINNYMNGKLDEVRIYNRALSKDEVRHLYEWAPGPVLHLRMDEKEGTTAYDRSGYGNDGTLTNGPTWTRGKYGSALSFDGVNDYIDLGQANTLNTPYAITIEGWVKSNTDISGRIIGKHSSSEYGWHLARSSSNDSFSWSISTNGSNWTDRTSSANSFKINTYYYVAAVYDGSNQKIYINGVEDTGGGLPYEITGNINMPSVSTQIGHTDYGGAYFDGIIDDVRIYNYARTQKQILEDMHNGDPMKGAVLDINFNEGYGGTAHDSSIYGNNGTLYPGTGGTNTASSAMWSLGGKVKGAMEFDGVDDFVSISNFQFPISNEFSITQFINFKTLATGSPIVSQWGGSQNNVLIKSDDINSDEIRICLADGLTDDCTNYGLSTDANLSINNWTNLQVIYDGSQSSNADKLKLYLDGYQKTLSFSGTIATDIEYNSTANLEIGGNSTIGQYSNTIIDELKIYSYALSEDEVRREYNYGVAVSFGDAKTADNDGTTVTGRSAEYCVPGDTAQCDAPVLELKMNEKKGSTAYDTSGNGNDGTISGATWGRGKYGSALDFDGDNDLVNVGNDSSLDIGTSTIMAWIKPRTISNTAPRIFNKSDSCYGFCLFIWESSGLVGFYANNSLVFNSTSDFRNKLNEWSHIAVSLDGTTAIMYVNGIKENSVSWGAIPTVTDNLLIGNTGPMDRDFNGLIDDVKIYNYARTPAQIAWEYNKGKPIAHWKFDECSGSTIHDNSGNGNHGTLHLGSSGTTATGTCASSSDSFWYNGRNGADEYSGSFDGGMIMLIWGIWVII